MRRIALLVLGAGAMAAAAPAFAHHSYAMFDAQQNKQLDGVVLAFAWTNPHSFIEVQVNDEKGQPQKWGVECGSPSHLVRAGWTKSSLKPGDHVVVTIHPLRSGELGGQFVQVHTADGKDLRPN